VSEIQVGPPPRMNSADRRSVSRAMVFLILSQGSMSPQSLSTPRTRKMWLSLSLSSPANARHEGSTEISD